MQSSIRKILPHLFLILLFCCAILPQLFLVKTALLSEEAGIINEAPLLVKGTISKTLQLGILSVFLAVAVGSGCAYIVTHMRFPGLNAISILLCLPFAIPPGLMAGLYISLNRAFPTVFPPLNNLWGAAVIFCFSLFPWVYLPMKVLLTTRSGHYRELGMTLGLSKWQRFWKIDFRLALPTLGITGLLVFMQTLNDFSVPSLLGVKTLTVAIHDAMFSMYRSDWAAQLSLVGLTLPILAVLAFAFWQHRKGFYNPRNRHGQEQPKSHNKWLQALFLFSLGGVLFFTIALPVGILLFWSFKHFGKIPLNELGEYVIDSLIFTLSVSGLTLLLALAANLIIRIIPRKAANFWHAATFLFNLNFAMPTIMLAIALLFMSRGLPETILSDTVTLMIIGGCLTFLCFPYLSIRSGFSVLHPDIEDLCKTCGLSFFEKVRKVYAPLLKNAISCGLLLTIVNCAKEIELSEVLQPFGFKTLSMRLFELTRLDLLEESAIFSLCLILMITYPLIKLHNLISQPIPGKQ